MVKRIAAAGLTADDLLTLLFTCVGTGEYRSRAGGGPGAPVRVRQVVPRLAGQ